MQRGHSQYPLGAQDHRPTTPTSERSRILGIRKLQPADRHRLAGELSISPMQSGYEDAEWSGTLLARHLLMRYGVVLDPRHCRRILVEVRGMLPRDPRTRDRRPTRVNLESADQRSTVPTSLPPLGMAADTRNKRIVLKRLQRLCSAGLPMTTFAMTLFDLVGDAIPHGDIRIMTGDFANHRWLTNVDISSWASTFGRLLKLPPQVQGITMDPRVLGRKELWRHEELEVGSFERGAGYNEFARHIGFHHVLSLMLHGPDGRLGNYPIWRSRDMAPFSRQDHQFAAAILPHLNHAVAVAEPSNEEITESDDGFSPLGKYQLGLVTIDANGGIRAINRAAQSIFYSLQAIDDSRNGASGSVAAISDSLSYISGVLRKIFFAAGGPDPETPAPIVRLMNHASGYQLRMRGYAAEGDASNVFFVSVEAGETADRFAKRVMFRYGLNRSQAELLTLVANSPRSRPSELAARLNIRPDTLRKSLRRLADRLDLDSQAALRTLSQGLRTVDPKRRLSPAI